MALALLILACNLTTIGSQPTPERIARTYKLLPALTSTPTGSAPSPTVPEPIESPPEDTPTPVPQSEALLPPTPTFTPELVQTVVTEPTIAPPTPTLVPTSEPTVTPTLTPTLAPTSPAEWSFVNVRLDASQYEDDLLFYGNVINNTDSAQALTYISGIFYDDQNQVIADEQSTYDYWLVDVIPPKAQVPFELTVADVKAVAKYDFLVEAEPDGESKSSDFEFNNVQASTDTGDYCLEGTLKNRGRDINDYVTLIAVLYDDQDGMINFSDDELYEPLNNGDEEEFYICADSLGQQVARYELQAWGE